MWNCRRIKMEEHGRVILDLFWSFGEHRDLQRARYFRNIIPSSAASDLNHYREAVVVNSFLRCGEGFWKVDDAVGC